MFFFVYVHRRSGTAATFSRIAAKSNRVKMLAYRLPKRGAA
jgi:hypothetical protein